jgi:DNA excision repair protein ERCC-1
MTSTASTSNAPPVVVPGSGKNIVINPLQVSSTLSNGTLCSSDSQRGNPVLECIRNVGKEFGDIIADYQVGRTTGVLYLR